MPKRAALSPPAGRARTRWSSMPRWSGTPRVIEHSTTTPALPVVSSIGYGDPVCALADGGVSCAKALSGHGFAITETRNDMW